MYAAGVAVMCVFAVYGIITFVQGICEKFLRKGICDRVLKKVCPGSIVLFHNDADNTPAALPEILECLKNDGYEFVFISDLILKENYTIDHTGKQCKINS